MRIPLPKMMRAWREREFERGLNPATQRYGLKAWAWLAKRPALYRYLLGVGVMGLKALSFGRGRFRALPFASGWTKWRDLPAPEGMSFQLQWAQREARKQEAGR